MLSDDPGHRKLAAAVLAEGIRDLGNDNPVVQERAERFLSGGGLFSFWCEVAGYDEGPALERAAALIESTRQQRDG